MCSAYYSSRTSVLLLQKFRSLNTTILHCLALFEDTNHSIPLAYLIKQLMKATCKLISLSLQ